MLHWGYRPPSRSAIYPGGTVAYLYEIVARIPRDTAIPADAVEIVHHWLDSSSSTPDTSNINDMIDFEDAFWNNDSAQTRTIGSYLASCISRVADSFQFLVYGTADLSGATPFGPPLDVASTSISGPAGDSDFPAEVAVCLSFHGDLTGVVESAVNPSPPPATIRPAARRRGRSYIGPIMGDPGSVLDANDEVIVSDVLQTDLSVSASRLRAAGSIDFNWVVWSKRDAAAYEVVGGFVGDSFDTQRRRGNAEQSRTVWT